MEKEFEALQDWLDKMISHEINIATKEHLNQLKSFLTELKAIKEAKPSEALKRISIRCHSKVVWDDPIDFDLDTIKQALLKAQKMEKTLKIISLYIDVDDLAGLSQDNKRLLEEMLI